MHERQLTLVVSGVVQGVFFRQFVIDNALRLHLSGFVENQNNGTLKIVAEGPEDVLEAFIPVVMRGPAGAHVKDIEAHWKASTSTFRGFVARSPFGL